MTSMTKHLDVNALPFDTPLILMTAKGDLLDTKASLFVELNRVEDGMVVIKNATDKSWSLQSHSGVCKFAFGESRFETKISPSGYLVFEESVTGKALGIEIQGREKMFVCRSAFAGKEQEWIVLKPHELESATAMIAPVRDLKNLAAASSDAARGQLAMRLMKNGKSTENVREIMTLLYGTTAPYKDLIKSDLANVERRLRIVELVELGRRPADVKNFLVALYGTTAPLRVKAEADTKSMPNGKGTWWSKLWNGKDL